MQPRPWPRRMGRRRRLEASPPPPRLAPGDPSSRRLSFSTRRRRRSGEGSELDPPRPRRGVGEESGPGGRAQGGRGGAARARPKRARSRVPPAPRLAGSSPRAPSQQLFCPTSPTAAGDRCPRRAPLAAAPRPRARGREGPLPAQRRGGEGLEGRQVGHPPQPATSSPHAAHHGEIHPGVCRFQRWHFIVKAEEQSLETLGPQMKYSARVSGGCS